MNNTAVIGAQWGDEGKAKIVDILSEKADIIARYQGGANAGHTVISGDRKYIFHLVPTGILHPDKICVIGNGVVVDLEALLEEIETLKQEGVQIDGRIKIASNAHVVLPFHKLLDTVMEDQSGDQKIGTTQRGIGPTYTDKVSRVGIRVADLFKPDVLRERLSHNLQTKDVILTHLFKKDPISMADVLAYCQRMAGKIEGMVCDAPNYLHQAIGDGKSILFEGAQGTLLDIDFGTYPYLTSSNPTIGGVFSGTGINPGQLQHIIGIVKAYQTRVGTGPFPTECLDATGEKLRALGGEFGATTGRPRRCGWLDLVALRYAARINGFTQIALTKMDVLDHFDRVKVCRAYRFQSQEIVDFPTDSHDLARCEPIYEELPGWKTPVTGQRSFSDLAQPAVDFIQMIETWVDCPVTLVSTGPERSEIITKHR